MLVEIRDRTLVERLKALLPRPDAPLDVAIAALLEQCGRRREKRMEEVVRRAVEDATAGLISWLGKMFDELPERVAAAVASAGGGWEAVLAAMKKNGGCLKFKTIEKIYGKSINSKVLRNKGLVNKGRGVWCLNSISDAPLQTT